MVDPQTQPQIEGLPPGAILKPIPQPAISGLPPGAILKPIGNSSPETPASMLTVPQQMDRAANRDYGQTSMSAGTSSPKAPVDPYAVKPNTFKSLVSNAGIPTSQPATTEAVRSMLSPDADQNETDWLLKKEEQIPVLGADFRARADLSKRADKETGAVKLAHKVASYVPLAGQALTAAQDKYDQGDYTGAIGAGINALFSMEGVKGAVKPKPTVPEGSRPPTQAAINQPELPAPAGTYTGPPVNAPVPATTLSKILGGGPEAMAKKPLAGATAAGKASNADVAAYAKSKGIDLLPGQATGARGLQTVQAIGERAVVAPGELPEVLDKQKAAFGNLVDDFKTRVGTETIPNTEAAGQSLKSQAQAGLENLKSSAQSDYQAFQQQAGDIPVDLADVKAKAAASLASQAEALKNVPAQYANPVRNVLKKLSDLQAGGETNPKALADFQNAVDTYGLNPEQQAALRTKLGLPDENGNSAVKMSTAQQLRSAYLDISRDYTGNVPKSVQRYAAQAAKDIDAAMAKAADQIGATQQWRQANAKWKQLQETYNNSEHPLYKVLQEPDPSKVPSKLLGKGNYGGSPQTVRQLQQAGIDISPLKREVAQQIADRNFALTNGGRGLAGYSSDFLKTLFSPEEFDELTKMGRIGRAIKFEMNPSGTSNVIEGRHQLMSILHGTVGATVGPLASRLTTSKALARAAMGDIPAAAPRGVLDILGSRGPEPPPETPPASGTPSSTPPAPGTPPVAPEAKGMAAAPVEERGIKAPQKRTFERVDEKGVKDFFSYRFDQLRGELKAAQAAGDQSAIADVQRRMNELDHIQRQPRSLQDVLAGKPPQQFGAEVAKASSVNSPAEALAAQNQAAQQLFGKDYDQLTLGDKGNVRMEAVPADKGAGSKPSATSQGQQAETWYRGGDGSTWLTKDPKYAAKFGTVSEVKASPQKVLDLRKETTGVGGEAPTKTAQEWISTLRKKGVKIPSSVKDELAYEDEEKIPLEFMLDSTYGTTLGDILPEAIKDSGFDAVRHFETARGAKQPEAMFVLDKKAAGIPSSDTISRHQSGGFSASGTQVYKSSKKPPKKGGK